VVTKDRQGLAYKSYAGRGAATYALSPIPQIPVGQFKVIGGQLFAGKDHRAIYNMSREVA
jgi:hypothetical protein